MSTDRIFDWFPIVALAALFLLNRWQAFALRRQGVRVIVWRRPWGEYLYDQLLGVVFVLWVYLLAAEAWPQSLAWLPSVLSYQLVDFPALKVVGALLLLGSPLLFDAALHSLGQSWRMGVDRQTPGPLVTTGLYRWTRNPIYTSFDLTFIGTLLIHGRLVFLVLAIALILLLHGIIRREERFLTEHFGTAFRDYARNVSRYGIG